PGTRADVAAAALRRTFGAAPVDIDVSRAIAAQGPDRLRAVAEATLVRGRDALALSLAADVALLEDRPADAEEHAATALRLVDDPDLHVRVAIAQAARGQLAAAIEILDAQLAAQPGLERAGPLRARLLEEVLQLDSPP